jgi:signal transduction histidine kinase
MLCYVSYTSREIVYNYSIFKVFEFTLDLIPLYIYALTLHFCLIFPREKRITSNKYFFLLLYAIPLFIFWLYELRISYIALFIFIITYGLSSFFAIIHSYVTIKSPIEKTQVRWVIWGITICLLMLIFEFLPILLIGKTLFDQTFLLLSFIFFPLSIAFAITRYRLMDIDTLFDNTLIYATTLGVLAFLDIVIITALVNIQILSFRISEPVAMIIGVWAIIFTYIPIRNYIQNIIKRILKREIYDTNQVIIQFSRDLLTAPTINSAFEKMLSRIEDTLHPKGSIAVLRKETGGYLTFGGQDNEIPLEIDIAKAEKIHAPTLLFNIITVESLPDNYNGGLFVPITGTQGYLGHCILQNKHSGRLYDKEDIKLLNVMANQLAMTIEAILSRENAAKKEKEAIAEKERISREIHDGIGSRFVEAILLSDVVNKNIDDSRKIIKHSKELKQVLMEGLTDLRELIWTVEPGQNTLGNLVSYIADKTQYLKNKEDIKTNVITSVENENMPISSSMKLNIVRIIQEAITNTIKHASATKIDVTIEQKNDNMKIVIADNGQGFDMSNSHPNGYGMRNIRKRCEDIGAHLEITSRINEGTKIAIELKLSQ